MGIPSGKGALPLLSWYRSGAGIPVGLVREGSDDRRDSLSGSLGSVPEALAVEAVRDSCKTSGGRGPA
jgi:hypothetical protein